MKPLFTLSLFICLSLYVQALAPAIQWQKSLGGSSNDGANSIIQTSDGGYMIAGYTNSSNGDVSGNHGSSDYWLVKLNALGAISWQKSLGGSSNDEANSIIQTSDGGYMVVGYSTSNNGDVSGNHGSADYWLVKLNALGAISWQKSLGGSNTDIAQSVIQTSDGGYMVAGRSFSNDGDVSGNHGSADYWLVKLNALGVISWQKSLGGSGDDRAESIIQTSDGGYMVAGSSYSTNGDVIGNKGQDDFWIVKLDDLGVTEWQKCLSAYSGGAKESAKSIIQTSDGGYMVAGSYGNSYYDYLLFKLNALGAIEWQKMLGVAGWGGSSAHSRAYSIIQTSDGGYMVAGYSNPTNIVDKEDYWLVKLDDLGVQEWSKYLGGNSEDKARSIIQTSDGGYMVAGLSNSNDGNVSGNHGNHDYWIVKLVGNCGNSNEPNGSLASATPITTNVDVFGQIASSSDKDYLKFTTTGTNKLVLSLKNLPKNYNLQLYNAGGVLIGSSSNIGTTSESITLTNLAAGTYTAFIYGSSGAFSTTSCYTLRASLSPVVLTCNNSNEPNETFSTAKPISVGIDIKGQIASSTDKDYLKFTTTGTGTLTLMLTTLPADYDVKLYNSGGTQIGSSTAVSTNSETITITGLVAGTYTAYIYGYAGAYSSTSCYSLKVSSTGGGVRMAAPEEEGGEMSEDLVLVQELVLFPNPAQDKLTLQFGNAQKEFLQIKMMDAMGRLVYQKTILAKEGDNQQEINLAGFAKGMYIVFLEGSLRTQTQRLVVD